jgi:hypothetical protein
MSRAASGRLFKNRYSLVRAGSGLSDVIYHAITRKRMGTKITRKNTSTSAS